MSGYFDRHFGLIVVGSAIDAHMTVGESRVYSISESVDVLSGWVGGRMKMDKYV